MADREDYGQLCPVSMASEIPCSRWTTLVVRELLCGSTRFNELRRGLPKMPPAILSKRLKELGQSDVVLVQPSGSGATDYQLAEAGEELRPLIVRLGTWAQRWMESQLSLKNLDLLSLCGTCAAAWTPAGCRAVGARYSFCTRNLLQRRSAGGSSLKTGRSTSATSILTMTWTCSSNDRCVRWP